MATGNLNIIKTIFKAAHNHRFLPLIELYTFSTDSSKSMSQT